MNSRINPFTGEALPEFARTDTAAQVRALRARQRDWRSQTVEERVRALDRGLRYFDENREEIARCVTREMGRPLRHARGEIDGLLERARFLAEIAPAALATESVGQGEGLERAIVHESLGVVFIISAWNYPLLITINGLMAALLGGNTVLLKHSTQTLSLGEHFQKAFGGLVAHGVMDHAEAGQILAKRVVDHVIFTGSTESGRRIYQQAAASLLDCHLELGGKDAAYVAEDADLAQAAESLVDGAMFNSGQSCCGVERVFVHRERHDEFVERCQALIGEYVLGDPLDEATTVGPLVRSTNVWILEAQVAGAVEKGARVRAGGRRREIGEGTFFEPTLLTEVKPSMAVMREENFGPILPVMAVEDDHRALDLVNDSEYGLTSIIFTEDSERAAWFADGAETGTVFQNRCDYLDPALPWTGVKQSGLGTALSRYGLLGVTRRKAIHFRQGKP